MKKEYITPELEKITLLFRNDVLALSDPESSDSGGGYGQETPGEDPFENGGF